MLLINRAPVSSTLNTGFSIISIEVIRARSIVFGSQLLTTTFQYLFYQNSCLANVRVDVEDINDSAPYFVGLNETRFTIEGNHLHIIITYLLHDAQIILETGDDFVSGTTFLNQTIIIEDDDTLTQTFKFYFRLDSKYII